MAQLGYCFSAAPVAQLDRVLRFERSGRRFESVRARHSQSTSRAARFDHLAAVRQDGDDLGDIYWC